VLGKKDNFQYLQSLQDRKSAILESGIDQVEVLPFTEELSQMEAEEFLEKILIQRYRAKHIVIGFNHCFGKDRRGNFQLLKILSESSGFAVYQVEPVYSGDQKISSSLIRKYLLEGEIRSANRCLGRSFSVSGTIKEGRKMGRELGFPTANLNWSPDQVIPAEGVYATLLDGMPAMTNIGTKPTFGDNSMDIETYVLDWEGNLYGRHCRLEFVERIRGVQKFNGPLELKKQLELDREVTKEVFKTVIQSF
jgi:riboflavin kinase/FMN adenylyltransferase